MMPATLAGPRRPIHHQGMDGAIASRKVTYDRARLTEERPRSCSAFGDNIIAHM